MFTPEYLNDLVEATHAAATEFNMYLTNKVIDSVIGLFEYNRDCPVQQTQNQAFATVWNPCIRY